MTSAASAKMHRTTDEYGPSALEWFRRAPEYARVTKEFRVAGSSGINLIRAGGQPAGLYKRPAGEEFTLAIALTDGGTCDADHGMPFRTERMAFGTLALPPPHASLRYDFSKEIDALFVAMPRTAVSAALARENGALWTGDFGRLHATFFEDAAITELLLRLWLETKSGTPRSVIFVESLWHTVVHLVMAASGQARSGDGVSPHRQDWRLRRAIEYMQARLTEDVGLAEVAAAVDLSPSHFAALFRAGTGEPPHRWLMSRRIERARELLADPRKDMTEIALDCGFASSQHFATAFRNHHGITPTKYRQERLS